MLVQRITTSGGIDDCKLIAETEDERMYLKQLAEAGTMVSRSNNASSSITFRPFSSSNSVGNLIPTLISTGKIGKLDLTLRQNQNFTIDLKFISAAAPMDLTVYTAIKLQIKDKKGGTAIISLSLGAGLTVSGPDNNVLSIVLTPAQTELLCRDEYTHDILMETANSKTYYVEGKIMIERTGTR